MPAKKQSDLTAAALAKALTPKKSVKKPSSAKKPTPRKQPTPKQRAAAEKMRAEHERLTKLAKAATLNATRETTIPFGQAVSTTQVAAVESFLKKRDILKFLACTEKQLKSYSRNEISVAQMPATTQERLRQINDLKQYSKSWSRKTATICYILLIDRRKRARKSPAKKSSAPPTTTAPQNSDA